MGRPHVLNGRRKRPLLADSCLSSLAEIGQKLPYLSWSFSRLFIYQRACKIRDSRA